MTIQPVDDHVIRVPEGIDGWSENLFFLPYDYEQDIGVAMHLGRCGQDPLFWREFVVVYLPDGRLLTSKGFGHTADSDTVNGAQNLTYECVEPFRRWRAGFDGLVRETTVDDLLAGPIVEGPWIRASFEFDFEALFDVPWQAHTTPTAPGGAFSGTGSFHYEQVCASTATLTIEGASTTLTCRGFRDHTRGVRKFSARSGHTLLSCSFPDGLVGGFYQVRALDGTPNFNQGYTIGADGKPYDAEVLQAPRFGSRTVAVPSRVVLRDHEGVEHVIDGEPITSNPMTIVAPNDMWHGMSRRPADFSCTMSPARLRRNGVDGVGHLELSMLNELIDQP